MKGTFMHPVLGKISVSDVFVQSLPSIRGKSDPTVAPKFEKRQKNTASAV